MTGPGFSLVSTPRIMSVVLLALLPGLGVSAYFLGPGVLVNVLTATATVLLLEAFILRIRGMNMASVFDGSAVLTAFILALALPPDLPFWMTALGSGFAIVFGKHLYGGLGQNPFNPAMVGYAVLIISFPLAMSTWPSMVDGITAATPLDTMKFRGTKTVEDIWVIENGFTNLGGVGWQWINLAYLAGGALLLLLNVIRWQAPLAMLLTLTVLSAVFYDSGSAQSLGSPMFHLLSGGTMLVAFFVITDPVTSPDSDLSLLIFGIGIALITFTIRSIGAYPDGFAFAVLLMNATAPLIDHMRLRIA